MPWPVGIPTRRVTAGRGIHIERDGYLTVRMRVRSDRGLLVWAATGDRFLSVEARAEAGQGASLGIVLPCTDSAGWLDEHGREIDVSLPGSYTHRYVATIEGVDMAGRVVHSQKIVFVLPSGGTDLDLDRGVEAGSVEGEAVVVPSDWSLIVSNAQAAADRAETARDEAEAIAAAPDGIRDNADRAEVAQSAAEAAQSLAEGSAASAAASAETAQEGASDASGAASSAAAASTAAENARDDAEDARDAALAAQATVQTAITQLHEVDDSVAAAQAAQSAAEAARDEAEIIVAGLEDTGWLPVTLNAGFQQYSSAPQVRVKHGVAYWRGGVMPVSGQFTSTVNVGTYPTAALPSIGSRVVIVAGNANAQRKAVASQGGVLQIAGTESADYVVLDALSGYLVD